MSRINKNARHVMTLCAVFMLGYLAANIQNSFNHGRRFPRDSTPQTKVQQEEGVIHESKVEKREKVDVPFENRTEARNLHVDSNQQKIVQMSKKPIASIDSEPLSAIIDKTTDKQTKTENISLSDKKQLTNNVQLTEEKPPTYPNQSDDENKTADKPTYIDIDREMPDIDYLYSKLVIVTAFSQNHYKEAQGIIGTAQKTMPGKKIIIYDLGIREDTRKEVQKLCDVELRRFPFGDYPKFVKNLLNYSWKPIIINITLNEFGAIFWGDASVRFKDSMKLLLPYVRRHHGYMSLIHSFAPKVKSDPNHQYYHTNENMYSKLGVNRTEYYNSNLAPHFAANRQLFINSTTVQEKLVRPLVTCAVELACIAPAGSRHHFHRYDASALAVIAYKNLKGEWTQANNDNEIFNRAIGIERKNGAKYNPRTC